MKLSFRTIMVAALALGVFLPSAGAASYDAIYAFGDSLSDVGNVLAATTAMGDPTPLPPYVNGQFSNGPVWVQDLAAGLGLAPLTPSLLGGTDYAYGSGETAPEPFNISNVGTDILGNTPGDPGQLAQFAATHSFADPNALYTIWIGSNDLADILTNDPTNASTDIGIVAANIDTAINQLALLGGKNFLVLTVPDLGATPEAGALGARAQLSALSAGLDTTLVNGAGAIPSLAGLAAADSLNLQVLNTYALLQNIVSSPSTYGLTDVTDQCLVGTVVCANPNQYLFWDDQHPTAAGHAIVADAALTLLAPEPAPILLTGFGLIALVLIKRSVIA